MGIVKTVSWLWGNGHKAVVISLTYFVTALIFLIAAIVFVTLWPKDSFHPLSIQKPIAIHGPISLSGSGLTGEFSMCNSNGDLTVHISTNYQQERSGGNVKVVVGREFDAVRKAGCYETRFEGSPLPQDLTPGMWQFVSVWTVKEDGQTQSVASVSELFEVIH